MRSLSIGMVLLLIYLLSACSPGTAADVPTAASAQPLSPTRTSTTAPTRPASAPKIPVTWADLQLSGKLVFIRAQNAGPQPIYSIQQLDLSSGELTTRFQAPAGASIFALAVSAGGDQVIMAYSEPQGSDPAHPVPLQTLYTLPPDASGSPKILIIPPTLSDQYLQPELSPDGKSLYFSHVNSQTVTAQQPFPTYDLMRMAYPGGAPEKIADQAFWPRLSKDGARLAYISSDIHNGKNKLYLADPDGKNVRQVMMNGPQLPEILDAPNFSPDGASILFSASTSSGAAAPGWLEQALGIRVAQAHGLASEWWSVPLQGGQLTQLTHLGYTGLFGSNAPDGRYIAVYSADGLFIMKPDASAFTGLIQNLGGITGTVSWIK